MVHAVDAREMLAAEMQRRLEALPQARREVVVVTVVEPEVLAFERRRARKAARSRRWVGGLSLVSTAGMGVSAGVIVATAGPLETSDAQWMVFWAGWAVAAVAAGGSGAVVARNWSLLSGATVAVAALRVGRGLGDLVVLDRVDRQLLVASDEPLQEGIDSAAKVPPRPLDRLQERSHGIADRNSPLLFASLPRRQ